MFARLVTYLAMWLAIVPHVFAANAEPQHAPEAVKTDLLEMVEILERTHPNLQFSVKRKDIQVAVERIGSSLTQPMSEQEAWLHLALINPVLRDAHVGLQYPVAGFQRYREGGGVIFPLPVLVDRNGHLRAGPGVAEASGVEPYEHIIRINGQDTDSIITKLMPRMRGESESLQRLVLSYNFPAYYWALAGPQESISVEVLSKAGDARNVALAARHSANEEVPESPYEFTRPRTGVALLRIASFAPELAEEFAAFLQQSFDAIDAERRDILLIDIRDNPGGAHDVSDQLIGYLTDREIAATSSLTARVTPDNQDIAPGAKIGSVVTTPFREPIPRTISRSPYKGRVYLLVSEDSYSQAIVFAVTIKDHRLGQIVGERTAGNANQTGQVTFTPLANTRLPVAAPHYIIYRPSGDTSAGGLEPDIPLAHDPLDPDRMIDELLDQIAANG